MLWWILCTICTLAYVAAKLKLQLDQANRENARILRIGKRIENELILLHSNTQYITTLNAYTFGVNASSQLKAARRDELQVTYLQCDNPIGIVRRPITATVTLAPVV